jgi:hypothetical protein
VADRDGWLTIDQTADRYGVHRQTVAKRLDQLPDASKRKDVRGRWLLDPATVEEVTGWSAAAPAPERAAPAGSSAAAPAGAGSALQLLDQLAPLLQRVSTAEQERADAVAAARIAEHRLQAAEDAATGPRVPWWLAAALLAAGAIVGALVAALVLTGS